MLSANVAFDPSGDHVTSLRIDEHHGRVDRGELHGRTNLHGGPHQGRLSLVLRQYCGSPSKSGARTPVVSCDRAGFRRSGRDSERERP